MHPPSRDQCYPAYPHCPRPRSRWGRMAARGRQKAPREQRALPEPGRQRPSRRRSYRLPHRRRRRLHRHRRRRRRCRKQREPRPQGQRLSQRARGPTPQQRGPSCRRGQGVRYTAGYHCPQSQSPPRSPTGVAAPLPKGSKAKDQACCPPLTVSRA